MSKTADWALEQELEKQKRQERIVADLQAEIVALKEKLDRLDKLYGEARRQLNETTARAREETTRLYEERDTLDRRLQEVEKHNRDLSGLLYAERQKNEPNPWR